MRGLINNYLSYMVALIIMSSTSLAYAQTRITIATVNNSHMITMQELTPIFEKAHPDIKVKWITVEESKLREHITSDVTHQHGFYDVITIGMYEAPIWGEQKWIQPIDISGTYDVDDIIPSIREGLSYNNTLFAAPFYGESSMVIYRKDLVDAAGVTINDRDTWEHIRDVAAAIHDPEAGVYGMCLRGKAGWGDNMAFVTTMANSFGARWFDENWKPQLETNEWQNAVSFYVELLNEYGPPNASNNSFNENLSLFSQGKCGILVDATIAASFVTDPEKSKVFDKVGFAQSPMQVTEKGANWLWAWSLAIPTETQNAKAAQTFIRWATSKEYVKLIGETKGWTAVPTGTRFSTYNNPDFLAVASFAQDELEAINSANPADSTLKPSPYIGVQFASIPEFQDIGAITGQMVSGALNGTISVEQALKSANLSADNHMHQADYY